MITMSIMYVCDLKEGEVFNQKWGGNPPGKDGDIVEVPFSLGAHLVAAGLAEPAPEKKTPRRKKPSR